MGLRRRRAAGRAARRLGPRARRGPAGGARAPAPRSAWPWPPAASCAPPTPETVAVDAGLPAGLHRHGGGRRRRRASPARSTRRSGGPGGCPPTSARAVYAELRDGLAAGRRVRRRARRQDRGRAAQPLRDQRDQHGRAGARGDRRPAGRGCGLMLDTYHMNIEEKDFAGAFALAGAAHRARPGLGNDRGAPGADHIDWPGVPRRAARRRLRRPGRDRVVHRGERDDRHGGVDLAAARRRRRTRSPSTGSRSCASCSPERP